MDCKEERPHKWRGIFESLTQTGAEEITVIEASKEGDHGYKGKADLPQNHGPQL